MSPLRGPSALPPWLPFLSLTQSELPVTVWTNQTSKRQRRPERQDEPEAPHHPPLLRPPVAGAEGTVGQRGQWLPTALGARGQELSEEPRLRLPLARRLFSVRLLQLSSRAGSLGALGCPRGARCLAQSTPNPLLK